jgi:uncharacterized protein YqhQ
MPNIEIHGLSMPDANRKRGAVLEGLMNQPFINDLVVTIFPTEVRNAKGREMPFFRLLNSVSGREEDIIIPFLRSLGLDVEHLRLASFYEARTEEEDVESKEKKTENPVLECIMGVAAVLIVIAIAVAVCLIG